LLGRIRKSHSAAPPAGGEQQIPGETAMRFSNQAVKGLVSLALAAALACPALAQFEQQGAKLVGTGASGSALQGQSVALSANGNTAIAGGGGDNNNAGAAWVFTRSGSAWTEQGAKLVGTGAVGDSEQGNSVALSADGNTAIVGGPFDNGYVGAAWVFTRSGGVWSQQGAKLVGAGAVGDSEQGNSVALSADGNTAIVGGTYDNSGAGAAWVFTRSGSAWTQQGAKLVGTGAVGGANQGYSVALSGDGNTAIVGGPFDNGYVGTAWVFTRSGGLWSQQGAKLVGTGAVGSATQGWSVAVSGDGNSAIVGGPQDNNNVGAAWVFTRSAGVWTQQGAKLIGTGAVGGGLQGWSVALSADGNTALAGGSHDNGNAGAAWIFTRMDGVWTEGAKLVGTGAVGNANQGNSVALSADGHTAMLGGYVDNSGVGAAWVFASPRIARIGTYNTGQWYLDVNGNGIWDGDPPDISASNFGWSGATYVTGDWNGDGHTKMGVYYDGFWYLDYTGTGGKSYVTYTFGWSDPNVIPVVGDWNGDGRTKIGVYYQGFWYLDYDGNGTWDGGVNDKAYNFGWNATGVTPMVGDWSGNGLAKIGIYYNGFWYLDYNGNGIWDGASTDKAYTFGWSGSGVTPMIGDWNGDGRAKIGIYDNGYWYLDYNGNGVWDGASTDKAYTLGWSGVTPLVGDWSGSGTAKIGIYAGGFWYLDYTGDGVWDWLSTWGQTGSVPLVGFW
jgi:hypothetical protein